MAGGGGGGGGRDKRCTHSHTLCTTGDEGGADGLLPGCGEEEGLGLCYVPSTDDT